MSGVHKRAFDETSSIRETLSVVTRQSPKIDRITDQVLLVSGDADEVIKKLGPLVDHADGTVANVNSTIDQLCDRIQQDHAQLTLDPRSSLRGIR